jgi:hypothetical protein
MAMSASIEAPSISNAYCLLLHLHAAIPPIERITDARQARPNCVARLREGVLAERRSPPRSLLDPVARPVVDANDRSCEIVCDFRP